VRGEGLVPALRRRGKSKESYKEHFFKKIERIEERTKRVEGLWLWWGVAASGGSSARAQEEKKTVDYMGAKGSLRSIGQEGIKGTY